jgi:hypothetical protein
VELSQGAIAVFAHRNDAGEYTLTAIPWSEIRRIAFPGVQNLPQRIFD